MKKLSIVLALILIGITNILAQNVPQGINYQAVLQDSKGPIANKSVDLKLTILDVSNNVLYQEIFFSKNTESNGGINAVIGTGTVQVGTFIAVNWGAGERYLKVEVNIAGAGYQTYGGNVKFQSVPYALYSLNPGPKGDKGDKGDDGLQGNAGTAGKDGTNGKDGAAGSANINGTTNYVVKFTNSTTGGNSLIYDNGNQVSIGNTSPSSTNKLEVKTSGTSYNAINGITTGNFKGVYGEGDGIYGSGVFGINKYSDGTGSVGVGNAATAYYLNSGSGGAFTGSLIGVFGYSTSTATGVFRAGGNFQDLTSGTYVYVGAINTSGTSRKIEGSGTVNTVVKDTVGKNVVLSAIEAPENLFTDYGSGKLQNGKTHITLDPILSKNIIVNETHPIRIFIQLEGDCNGVYVTNKSGYGFDVIELLNGLSNVSFSWTIVASRADEVLLDGSVSKYSEERFAPAMGPLPVQSLLQK